MGFYNSDLPGTAELEEGRWHHAAFVYDAADQEQRIYLDGQLDETRSAAPFAGSQSEQLHIGQWGSSRYLDGVLDELRIWTEARSEADIQATMHQTIPADTTGLVASYRFDAAQTGQRWEIPSRHHRLRSDGWAQCLVRGRPAMDRERRAPGARKRRGRPGNSWDHRSGRAVAYRGGDQHHRPPHALPLRRCRRCGPQRQRAVRARLPSGPTWCGERSIPLPAAA